MKRILFFTRPIDPPWDEASKNFAYSLSKRLRNVLPVLLVNDRYSGIDKSGQKLLALYSKPVLTSLQKLNLIKLLFLRHHFDVAHIMLTPNTLNSLAARFIFSRKKKALTVASLPKKNNGFIRKISLSYVDEIITYTKASKKILNDMGFKNVTQIYPGIDIEKYKPKKNSLRTRIQWNIKKDDFVVAYPGEYTRLGTTDELVKLIPDLVAKVPNIKFIFACRIKSSSDTKKRKEIKQYMHEIGLENNVIHTDTIEDMASFYSMCNVILFPVKSMTGKFDVPLTIIEAMACGKPVIVSDLIAFKEFCNTTNSIIIPALNISTLVDRISNLYEEPKYAQKISLEARKYVVDNFDINQTAQMYEKIYKKL